MSRVAGRSHPAQWLAAWVGANFVGGFLVGFLENHGLQFAATLILTGAILGSAQWMVFCSTRRFRWWPLASAVGWIASTLLLAASQGLYRPAVDALWQQFGLWEVFWLNLVTGPLMVFGMAIAQSLVLQLRSYGTWAWILTSVLGGMAQGGVSAGLCAAACPWLPSWLVGIVSGCGWAAYGFITGLALIKLNLAAEADSHD
ncbi:hypothetical protein ACQ4M4_12310 [Leptolyngbya sp. AN02str]|uniref:hypothetical protein n=1 Tax=Leptolyngbya sp. AN02str TaxID=3423363 RepID=UPI003D314686